MCVHQLQHLSLLLLLLPPENVLFFRVRKKKVIRYMFSWLFIVYLTLITSYSHNNQFISFSTCIFQTQNTYVTQYYSSLMVSTARMLVMRVVSYMRYNYEETQNCDIK